MTQSERRAYLITELKKEMPQYADLPVSRSAAEQKALLRALFNVRMPKPIGKEFLRVQDAYLQDETRQKGVTELADLTPIRHDIYLWQGDITTLRCDAVVNAANSGLLGCFCPNHGCIDNAIHTFAGVQLRLACAALMKKQGHDEPTGQAKITSAFNLPCRCVIHTVGPIIHGKPTEKDCKLLRSCYRSCMSSADENRLDSVAFCCISTGEFHFPNERAAEIAVKTVEEFMQKESSVRKVIFNVFKDQDYLIYSQLLGNN